VLRPALTGPPRQVLSQVAQIYFQPSVSTGLVIVVALAAVRPWAAAGMLWASVVALAVSRLGRLDRASGEAGLLGYNAALTGAGLLSLFAPSPRVFAAVTVAGVVTPMITARWSRWGRLPPLTIQFVACVWAALWLGDLLGPGVAPQGCPDGPAIVPCGVGQVTFIAGALPGLAVCAAITWHAPIAGLWLGLGAAAGGLGGLLGAEAQAVGLAINAGLTAQALAVFDRHPALRLLGVALAAALCLLCARLAVPYFTLPFNLATWTILLVPARAATCRVPSPARAAEGSRGAGLC
jgi:urea transporter